jgi:hypothetical protein
MYPTRRAYKKEVCE